jgi:hypothetical protein
VISGIIWWNKADATLHYGKPATMCNGLAKLTIWVTNPKVKVFATGQPSTVGSLNITAAAVDLGKQWECSYTVTNLPVGVPLQVAVNGVCVETYSSIELWYDAQNNSVAPVGQAVGWDGSVTVVAPPPVKNGGQNGGLHRATPNPPSPAGGSGSGIRPIPGHLPGGVQFRHNPTGVGTVTDIDFAVKFVPAPFGMQSQAPANLFGTCFPPKQ